jgi:hypothetical protein
VVLTSYCMPRNKRFEEFKVGDLVRWKEPMGGPPFFIQGNDTFAMDESYLGVIYDVTFDGDNEVLTYMVRWSNGVIFPVFVNEMIMVSKGMQHGLGT